MQQDGSAGNYNKLPSNSAMEGDTAYETQPGTLRSINMSGGFIEPYDAVTTAAITGAATGYELPPDLPPDELKVVCCSSV